MDEDDAISGGQEVVKPGQVFFELRGKGERASNWGWPQGVEHPDEEEMGLRTDLGYVEQFAQQGAEIV